MVNRSTGVVRGLAAEESAVRAEDFSCIASSRDKETVAVFVDDSHGRTGKQVQGLFRRVPPTEGIRPGIDYWRIDPRTADYFTLTPITPDAAENLLRGRKSSAPNCPVCKEKGLT